MSWIWIVIAIAVSWLGGFLLGVNVEGRRSRKIFLAAVNSILEVCEEESPT